MTASAQDIVEALYTAMTTPGSLNTNLGGRIYHQLGPQNQDQPYLVYDVLANRASRGFGNNITYEMDAHFDIFVKRSVGTAAALGAGTLEENLFDALDGQTLTVSGLDRAVVLFNNRGVRTIEEDVIRISNDARIVGTSGASGVMGVPLLYTNSSQPSTSFTNSTTAIQTMASHTIPAGTLEIGGWLEMLINWEVTNPGLNIDLSRPKLQLYSSVTCGANPLLNIATIQIQPKTTTPYDIITLRLGWHNLTGTQLQLSHHLWTVGPSQFGIMPLTESQVYHGLQGEVSSWDNAVAFVLDWRAKWEFVNDAVAASVVLNTVMVQIHQRETGTITLL